MAGKVAREMARTKTAGYSVKMLREMFNAVPVAGPIYNRTDLLQREQEEIIRMSGSGNVLLNMIHNTLIHKYSLKKYARKAKPRATMRRCDLVQII